MRKLILIIILFNSCVSQKNISVSYQYGVNRLGFDTVAGKFVFVDRRELKLVSYSEGMYERDSEKVYLVSNPFDSCIKFDIKELSLSNKLIFNCINYDERFDILYRINDNNYNSLKDGIAILELPETDAILITIKIPFPDLHNSTCYRNRDSLHSSVLLQKDQFSQNGVSLDFKVNYNYFNYVPFVDTLTFVKSKKLQSKMTNYVYERNKEELGLTEKNFLRGCLFPPFSRF